MINLCYSAGISINALFKYLYSGEITTTVQRAHLVRRILGERVEGGGLETDDLAVRQAGEASFTFSPTHSALPLAAQA